MKGTALFIAFFCLAALAQAGDPQRFARQAKACGADEKCQELVMTKMQAELKSKGLSDQQFHDELLRSMLACHESPEYGPITCTVNRAAEVFDQKYNGG